MPIYNEYEITEIYKIIDIIYFATFALSPWHPVCVFLLQPSQWVLTAPEERNSHPRLTISTEAHSRAVSLAPGSPLAISPLQPVDI